MSLIYKDTIAHGTKLGIWKKEEELDTLESVYLLNESEQKEFNTFSNIKRKQEWLTTRILLTELLEQRSTIKYNENGSPYLENNFLNISVTHSKYFVAIISSKFYKPGLDIEHISERVSKIKHKFLNTDELNWCKNLKQMTAAWSVKEAIYKTFEKELDFHDIIIQDCALTEDRGFINAEVIKKDKEKDFTLNYIQVEDDILVYTLTQP